jgi:hypothetical protein
LAHAQIALLIFEASSISETFSFQRVVGSVFCFPSAPSIFIDHPTAILPMCHRGAITRSHAALRPTRPHLPLPVSSPFHDLPELWHAGCIDCTFVSSLFISLRRSDASSFSVRGIRPGQTRYFQSMSLVNQRALAQNESPRTIRLKAVIAIFSLPDLSCEGQDQRGGDGRFVFHFYCTGCEPNSRLLVRFHPCDRNLIVRAQGCCSHFFMRKGLVADRHTGPMFMTRPHVA